MEGIKESIMSSKARYVDNRVFIGLENNREGSRISEQLSPWRQQRKQMNAQVLTLVTAKVLALHQFTRTTSELRLHNIVSIMVLGKNILSDKH